MWKYEVENPRAVVVIIHGAFEHRGRYKWLTEMLRGEQINVVVGDLPGQGTSTRRRGHIDSFDLYIKAISEFVEEARSYNLPIFFIGHSMGGLAIIRGMQETSIPVSAIILSSPCFGLVEPQPISVEWLSKALNIVIPTYLVDCNLEASMATRNKAIQELDENDSLFVTKVSIRWYRELTKAMKLAFQNIEQIPDIPILVMQGGDDKIVDKAVVKEWFNTLDVNEKYYKEWPELYHEIFNEPEREQVFEFAKGFIDIQLGKQ